MKRCESNNNLIEYKFTYCLFLKTCWNINLRLHVNNSTTFHVHENDNRYGLHWLISVAVP